MKKGMKHLVLVGKVKFISMGVKCWSESHQIIFHMWYFPSSFEITSVMLQTDFSLSFRLSFSLYLFWTLLTRSWSVKLFLIGLIARGYREYLLSQVRLHRKTMEKPQIPGKNRRKAAKIVAASAQPILYFFFFFKKKRQKRWTRSFLFC